MGMSREGVIAAARATLAWIDEALVAACSQVSADNGKTAKVGWTATVTYDDKLGGLTVKTKLATGGANETVCLMPDDQMAFDDAFCAMVDERESRDRLNSEIRNLHRQMAADGVECTIEAGGRSATIGATE